MPGAVGTASLAPAGAAPRAACVAFSVSCSFHVLASPSLTTPMARAREGRHESGERRLFSPRRSARATPVTRYRRVARAVGAAGAMRRRRGSSPGDGAAPASSPVAALTAPAAAAPRPAAPAARPRGAGSARSRLPPQLQSLLPRAASPALPLAPSQPARYALLVCTVASDAAGARAAVAAAAQQLAGAAAADAAAPPHRSGWPAPLLPRPRVLWHLAGLPAAEATAPVPPAPLWLPSSAAHAALLRTAAHCAAPEPPSGPASADVCGAATASAVAAACAAVPRGALCDVLWLCGDTRCDSDAAADVAAALLAARDAHGERLCTTLLSVVSDRGAASLQAGLARDLAGALSARLVLVPAAPPRVTPVPDEAASPAGWGRPVALPPPPPLLPLLLDAAVLWRGALCFPDPRRGAVAATGAAQGGRGAGPERPLRGLAALALPLTAVLPAADAPEPGVRYDGLQICADEQPLAGAARCASLRSGIATRC